MESPTLSSKLWCTLITLVLCFNLCCSIHVYPEDDPENPMWYSTPTYSYYTPSNYPDGGYNAHPVSGYLRFWNHKTPSPELNGTILVLVHDNNWSPKSMINAFKHSGILALLITIGENTTIAGYNNWGGTNGKLPYQPFPAFQLTWTVNETLWHWVNNQTNGTWVSLEDDPNEWDVVFTWVLPALGLVILVYSGAMLLLAAFKLVVLVHRDGFILNVSQLVLWFSIVGCLIRVIWAASDPFGAYNTTNSVAVELGLSLSYPFAIGSSLLLSLYWHELIRKTGPKMNPFLDNMMWPFIAICSIMFAFESVTGICRGLLANFGGLVVADGVMYLILVLGLLIYFTVTRIRLQIMMNQINKGLANSKHGKKLSVANTILTLISLLLLVWIIAIAYIGLTLSFWTPAGFATGWSVLFMALQTVVLLQILLIRTPPRSLKWFFCGLCMDNIASDEVALDSMATASSARARSGFGANTPRSATNSSNSNV